MRAYEVLSTRNPKYLATAETIVDGVETSSPMSMCGNGVTWKNRDYGYYKNAITNELFMTAAAKLAWLETDTQKQSKYLQYAVTERHWFFDKPKFSKYNLLNKDYSINDGYKYLATETVTSGLQCFPEDTVGQVWTYNQGVILGGMLYLYHDLQTLDAAKPVNGAPTTQQVKAKIYTLMTHDLASSRFINDYHDALLLC